MPGWLTISKRMIPSLSVVADIIFFAAAFASFAADDDLVMTPGNAEVVVPQGASPAAYFAADEMTNFLSAAFGANVEIKPAPTAGKVSIVLGDGPEARAAGIDVGALPLDAFSVAARRLETGGGIVCIAGRDDPKVGPRQLMQGNFMRLERTERATLNGAYDFLERHVGVRMYFPGEMGTVVPRTGEVRIRVGMRTEVPDFLVRSVYLPADGVWYEGAYTNLRPYRPCPPKSLNWMRLRLQSGCVPCVHGQSTFRYTERFAASHPEYFRLKENGKRNLEINPAREHDGNTRQLCHTSRVWDEIYADAKAYLTGRPAGERGLGKWGFNTYGGLYVDIMPQDGFQPCQCAACKAAYSTKYGPHYATDLIWSNTVAVANRLRAEGVRGFVTQMAYTPYAGIPSVEIPDNVKVMVAESGPWIVGVEGQFEKECRHVRDWSAKVGGKVWLWTYLGKISTRSLPVVPQMTPMAYARFFQRLAPYSFGAFCETESDRAIYNYLNYYVFAKIGWKSDCDVRALLDEHYRLMFGAGADRMREIYEEMERKWVREICGGVDNTPLGPVPHTATFREICAGPYSPGEISRMASIYDAALAAVPLGSVEARRIAFIRRQFHEPLAAAVMAFADRTSPARALARRQSAGENRSLVVDADSFLRLSDEAVWRISPKSKAVVRDEGVFVTGPASMRIESDRVASVAQPLGGRLKPGTRYRMSFFLKLENVRPTGGKKPGVFFQCYDAKTWHWFPRAPQFGTVDWSYEEHEFTTLPDAGSGDCPLFEVLMRNVTGRAWIDDIRIEELPPGV